MGEEKGCGDGPRGTAMETKRPRGQEPDRETVRKAVERAFPYPNDVLREMRWDSLDGCWLINRWGMTIGIETDGYVHS